MGLLGSSLTEKGGADAKKVLDDKKSQLTQNLVEKANKEIKNLLKKKIEIDKNLIELEHTIQEYESLISAPINNKKIDEDGDAIIDNTHRTRKRTRFSMSACSNTMSSNRENSEDASYDFNNSDCDLNEDS